jgi:hypothetical protein
LFDGAVPATGPTLHFRQCAFEWNVEAHGAALEIGALALEIAIRRVHGAVVTVVAEVRHVVVGRERVTG